MTEQSTSYQNHYRQKVYIKQEAIKGTQIKPVATDVVIGASEFAMAQGEEYVNSPEIQNSLNLKDRTKSQTKAGTSTLDTLIRPTGYNVSTKVIDQPMGGTVLESLFGKLLAFTCAVVGVIATGTTTIPFDTFAGAETQEIPQKGVIKLTVGANVELIYYTGVTFSSTTAGSFTGCTRDYLGDGSIITVGAEVIALACPIYKQSLTRPSSSIYRTNGGTGQHARGAVTTGMQLNLGNEGQVVANFSFEFMEGGETGISTLNGIVSASADLILQTDEAKLYSIGSIVYNATTNDHNTGAGYLVTAINVATHTITIETTVSWSDTDQIAAYLPDPDDSAFLDFLISQDTIFQLDSVNNKPKTVNIAYNAPAVFNDDEITPDQISDYTEDFRDITTSVNFALINSRFSEFYDAANSIEKAVSVRLGAGTAGSTAWVEMPRTNFDTPVISQSAPTMEIALDITALNTEEEDSFFLIFV